MQIFYWFDSAFHHFPLLYFLACEQFHARNYSCLVIAVGVVIAGNAETGDHLIGV
jgi:hypothetical protein